MKFALVILSYFILLSCKNEQVHVSESELQQQDFEERKALAVIEVEKKHQKQSERFNLYLGMIVFDKTKFKSTDTLISFWHDFSFAGGVAGKVCQIFKTDSSISLSEVFYGNRHRHLSNDSSFTFMNFNTGDTGSTVHSYNSFKNDLDVIEWITLMKAFEKECFFHLPPYDSVAVLDGTMTSLSIECQDRLYSVHRRWLEKDSFYRLCKMIDNLTKNQLDNL